MGDSRAGELQCPALPETTNTTRMQVKGRVEHNGAGRATGVRSCSFN